MHSHVDLVLISGQSHDSIRAVSPHSISSTYGLTAAMKSAAAATHASKYTTLKPRQGAYSSFWQPRASYSQLDA